MTATTTKLHLKLFSPSLEGEYQLVSGEITHLLEIC